MEELRRFQMINGNDSVTFFKWCDKKGITRKDLMCILAAVQFNPDLLQDRVIKEYTECPIDFVAAIRDEIRGQIEELLAQMVGEI